MNGNIEYDTAESGLRAVLKDYQELALRAIWANPEGLGSKAVGTESTPSSSPTPSAEPA